MNKGKLLNFYKNIFFLSFPKIIFSWLEEQLWPYVLATDKAFIWIFSFPFKSTYDAEVEILDKVLRKHDIYHRKEIVPIAGQLHCQINNVMVLFAVFQNFTADQESEFYKVPLYPPEKTAFGFYTLSPESSP